MKKPNGHKVAAERPRKPKGKPSVAMESKIHASMLAGVAGAAGKIQVAGWSGMDFTDALRAMKGGVRVRRKGWNAKNMWICLGAGHADLPADKFWNAHTREFAITNGGTAEVLPYIIMKTADNKILMGWLASQTDMLATDWEILL